MLKRLVIGLVAVLFLPALLASCGSSDDAASGPSIAGAWARSSPMVADAGAAYLSVTSEEADSIVGVSVDSSVAATAELHETVMVEMDETMGEEGDDDTDADMDMDSDMEDEGDHDMDSDMGGAMTMQEVTSIPVAVGETVSFAPGGLHVMLMGLVDPLEVGDEFDVTLTFENAGDVVVTVEVRDDAP
ncbi:MAG: copper chaperone PCu(A)C [Actinomycetia bacterium]|nr:copper chaperone PCu(A)C [Actinomycetes bacterium]